jgi:hypothetical protein
MKLQKHQQAGQATNWSFWLDSRMHHGAALTAGEVSWMAVEQVAHPGIDERTTRGSQARDRTPPSSHAGWRPAADRPDPVGLLEYDVKRAASFTIAARNNGFAKAGTQQSPTWQGKGGRYASP